MDDPVLHKARFSKTTLESSRTGTGDQNKLNSLWK